MSFGQQSGPPATARQVNELLDLLRAAGHTSFRDARGPMGFTQRQAGGKFTRDEAAAFIEQLQGLDDPEASAAPALAPAPTRRRPAPPGRMDHLSSDELAAELQRRGWVVMEP